MKSTYEQMFNDDSLKKKQASSKTKKTQRTKIIFHIFVIIILALCFIVMYTLIKVRDEIITNHVKRRANDDIKSATQESLEKMKEAEITLQTTTYEKQTLLQSKGKVESSLYALKNRTVGLVNKRDTKKRHIELSSSITSFLKLHQIDKVETDTKCTFISNCYRMSRDGLSAQAFHKNCDGLKPTVTLIETNNEAIFGGITYESWEGNGVKYDPKAFLFSIVLDMQYYLNDGKPAINASPDLLPTFGIEDIFVSEKESYVSNPLQSFGSSESSHHDKSSFSIKEIEVYLMNCSKK